MSTLLFWLYLMNAVFLIIHEMDSAYWREWELFKLPGGITGFLIIHVPLIFLILYGMLLLHIGSVAGLIISLFLSLAGIFAFSIHLFFLLKGRKEFRIPISIIVLTMILLISIGQFILTVTRLAVSMPK